MPRRRRQPHERNPYHPNAPPELRNRARQRARYFRRWARLCVLAGRKPASREAPHVYDTLQSVTSEINHTQQDLDGCRVALSEAEALARIEGGAQAPDVSRFSAHVQRVTAVEHARLAALLDDHLKPPTRATIYQMLGTLQRQHAEAVALVAERLAAPEDDYRAHMTELVGAVADLAHVQRRLTASVTPAIDVLPELPALPDPLDLPG